ncbi:hypothetical protein AB5J72_24140 [Streptomyces sp. CG1]|uniref:hypothetical protein n=1 Tax=Streptomyces sp. CG1 TaxID=1287523 RepID=UPI0034E2F71A
MLHSLANRRDAPAFLGAVGARGTPVRAVLVSAAVGFLCVPLEAARPGEADELAHAAVFLMENTFTAGITLDTDGGLR